MSKSSVRSRDRLHSYALGAALLVVTLLVVFVQRPTVSPSREATSETSAPVDPTTSASPASTTSEEFCAGFRRFAESQAQFAAAGSDGGADLLEASADALVAEGVPDTMSLPARSGYFTLISGVYDSLGLEVAPEAVGAPDSPIDGSDAAFSTYLSQNCPA